MANLTAMQSKQALAKTLLSLLETEQLSKITISEIASGAGLARLTFYRHFDTKEAVLEWYLQKLFQEYLEEHRSSPVSSLKDALALCFVFWKRNASVLHTLSLNGLEHLLCEPFDTYVAAMLEKYGARELNNVQIRFLAGGLSFAMLQWIADRSNEHDAQTAADNILSLIDLSFLFPSAEDQAMVGIL